MRSLCSAVSHPAFPVPSIRSPPPLDMADTTPALFFASTLSSAHDHNLGTIKIN
jgi:hypothetical protein